MEDPTNNMETLKLVHIGYQTKLFPGLWVIPSEGSGLMFRIGQIKEVNPNGLYSIVVTNIGEIQAIYHKLQPIKLYLVKKESFNVGDWYFSPARPKPKKPVNWGNYSPKIGRISKELDAKLFSLSNSLKVVHKPEEIGLMRSPYDNITVSLGDVIPLDPIGTSKIMENGGNCYVEEIINGKVLISHEVSR